MTNVEQTEGLGISDALNILQETMWLFTIYNALVVNRLMPSTVEALQEQRWMANTLVERMGENAELARTILERLKMTCDETQEAEA